MGLFPFVLILTKRSSVVGVASLVVCLVFSVLSVSFFVSYFCVTGSYVLFLHFAVVLPVASSPGEGRRKRPDEGA